MNPSFLLCIENKSGMSLETNVMASRPANEPAPSMTMARIDKPKRSLTAYNLFFQQERQKILNGLAPPDKQDHQPKRSHGKIGFTDLAREVSSRWKAADKATISHFNELAAKDKVRYQQEMDQWEAYKRGNIATAPQKVCLDEHGLNDLFAFAIKAGLINPAHYQSKEEKLVTPEYQGSLVDFGKRNVFYDMINESYNRAMPPFPSAVARLPNTVARLQAGATLTLPGLPFIPSQVIPRQDSAAASTIVSNVVSGPSPTNSEATSSDEEDDASEPQAVYKTGNYESNTNLLAVALGPEGVDYLCDMFAE